MGTLPDGGDPKKGIGMMWRILVASVRWEINKSEHVVSGTGTLNL